jgi:hypothetical protein
VFITTYINTNLLKDQEIYTAEQNTTGRRPGARTPRRSLHQRILHLLSSRA